MLTFNNCIIPAVRSDEDFLLATKSPVECIFMIKANILTLKDLIKKANGKKVFVHIDMAEGVGKDKKGIELLKKMGVDGIISTKSQFISFAKEINLCTIQRFFIVDTLSVLTALDTIKKVKADYIEIMPGIIPKIVKRFVKETKIPIIAGGLIEDEKDVSLTLNAGASAVSISKSEFWNLNL